MKTAQVLGIRIPNSILVRADKVIERGRERRLSRKVNDGLGSVSDLDQLAAGG